MMVPPRTNTCNLPHQHHLKIMFGIQNNYYIYFVSQLIVSGRNGLPLCRYISFRINVIIINVIIIKTLILIPQTQMIFVSFVSPAQDFQVFLFITFSLDYSNILTCSIQNVGSSRVDVLHAKLDIYSIELPQINEELIVTDRMDF